jgi:malonyl-CoA decarboxylase
MLGNWGTVNLSWLDRIWSTVAERGRELIRLPGSNVPPLERSCSLAEALVSERGEAAGAALAQALLGAFTSLNAEDRKAFFAFVARHFGPDEGRLIRAARAYLDAPGPQQAMDLAAAAEPPRQELLRRMNMAPGATAVLIAIRKELIALAASDPSLKPFESDLRHVLGSWFNRGFLELRRIDWNTPAVILEKLIAYEAVHQIDGWDDLRRRLAPDRRCFGFFHPTLPGEPLIFVEVALVKGMSGAIAPLLERGEAKTQETKAEPDTAIFYSISNCQEGLRGISFGNFLIKQVVEELKSELRSLKRFATLSPVPGFARWLSKNLGTAEAESRPLLRPEEKDALLAAAGMPDADPASALAALVAGEGWWTNPATAEYLQPLLLRLCALYLTEARDGKGPSDPVARFHLGNGARLEKINWLGNTAPRGLAESYGMMVNYLYDPDFIEINHENFVHQGAVARSSAVDALLQAAPHVPAQAAGHRIGIVPFPRIQNPLPKKKRPQAAAE